MCLMFTAANTRSVAVIVYSCGESLILHLMLRSAEAPALLTLCMVCAWGGEIPAGHSMLLRTNMTLLALVQDLLNLGGGPPSAAPAASSSGFDPLGSLGDSSFGAPPAPSSPPAFPTITAFSKDGISVSFAFSKPSGQPNVTDVAATYTNSDAAPVTGFSLQVLHPALHAAISLAPPSGSVPGDWHFFTCSHALAVDPWRKHILSSSGNSSVSDITRSHTAVPLQSLLFTHNADLWSDF